MIMTTVSAFLLVGVAMMIRDGDWILGCALLLISAGPIWWTVTRFRLVRAYHDLASNGVITLGELTTSEVRRGFTKMRGDRWTPSLPGIPRHHLRLAYTFHDTEGKERHGGFTMAPEDADRFKLGDTVEVFFLPEKPSINVCSLAMRFYFKLQGPAFTDETPPPGFPDQEDQAVH